MQWDVGMDTSLCKNEGELIGRLIKMIRHLLPDRTGAYFICGESGNKDSNGLPDSIMVCASYGSDHVEVYRKVARNEN